MEVLVAQTGGRERGAIEDIARDLGHETVSAGDGDHARRVLQGEDAPRLAVLGDDLPGLDGIEVCRLARGSAAHPWPYVILTLGGLEPGDVLAAVEAGADDFVRKPWDAGDLSARLSAGALLMELAGDAAATESQPDSRLDSLTGAMSGWAVRERLDEELAEARRDHTELSVGLLSIDRLSRLSAEHGQDAADLILRRCVRRIRREVRSGDVVGRLGPNEILVVLPAAGQWCAGGILSRIRVAVTARAFVFDGRHVGVTVSLGCANGVHGSADDLIADAREGLREAQSCGGNSTIMWPPLRLADMTPPATPR
jgi:two-component system, cell cycle response regulator